MRPTGKRTHATRLNETEQRQIAEWTDERVPQAEIARRLNCDRNTVLRWQKLLGFAGYRKPMSKETKREIVLLHEQKVSAQKIAQQFGFTPRRVLKVLHENKCRIKSRGRIKPEVIAAIDKDIREHKNFLYAIARDHNVGQRIVRQRKLAILGPGRLLGRWPPLQSKFSQIDAAEYVPSVEETLLQLVRKCIDEVAQKYLYRDIYDPAEVLAAKKYLKADPSPVFEAFDAGLRRAVSLLCVKESGFVN